MASGLLRQDQLYYQAHRFLRRVVYFIYLLRFLKVVTSLIPNKKIVITGAKGIIGTVLRTGLSGYPLRNLDLPWNDLRKYSLTRAFLKNADTVIHLAWNKEFDNHITPNCSADNTAMFMNILRAAIELKIPRLIMASSVHADNFSSWAGPGLMHCDSAAAPSSKYGCHKLFMELLSENYAKSAVSEIICIRFGWVNKENECFSQASDVDKSVFLKHEDCQSLIDTILKSKVEPGRFVRMYATSGSPHAIHDVGNPFGWHRL